MKKLTFNNISLYISGLFFSILNRCSRFWTKKGPDFDISYVDINSDIKLRRMIAHNPKAKGVVIFLHGFPETLYTWKELFLLLCKDFEVHAFDWPGYGLSTRPPVEKFSYSPKDYANILRDYIRKSGIDSSKLLIYATDIGSLPALLLALDEPKIMNKIIVGDFAPFDRPEYMYENLQSLKSKPSADQIRAFMNKNRDEILENTFRRGLAKEEQFENSKEFKDDMFKGWSQSNITSVDAFYYYYSHFTRDQNYFESNIKNLKTPVKVIWEKKIFISKKKWE